LGILNWLRLHRQTSKAIIWFNMNSLVVNIFWIFKNFYLAALPYWAKTKSIFFGPDPNSLALIIAMMRLLNLMWR
jgi:hypothetical protein